ncbi:MAG: addiction module protein [Melioribacteraceae bacterium]|nr:addiction module protein [Melioribacteraceae bacterium]
MISLEKKLFDKILDLRPTEKIFLLEAIVESLDKSDKYIQEIWLKEAQERLSAHRNGKTKGIPVNEVLGESL